MTDLSLITIAAWTAARAGAEKFGGSPRLYLGAALKSAWEASRQPKRKRLGLGRENIISVDLEYTGHVAGGGAVTPAVKVVTGYDQTSYVRYEGDYRSGSKRSGWIVWDLEEDRLYVLYGVAVSSRAGETCYVSTFGGQTVELTAREFKAEQARLFPQGAELAKVREEARRAEEERRAAERIEIEKRRIEENERRRIELAAETERIEAEGQGDTGMPELKGSPKQIAWALKIRAAYAMQHPSDAALKRGTTAKYWIDNHKSALWA